MRRRTLLTGGLAAAAVTVTGATPAAAARPGTWVTSWATSQVAPTPADTLAVAGFTDRTVRHVVRLSAGGPVRLRLANPFGAAPVQVGPVRVDGHEVTFCGDGQAWLAAGATLTSDPVALVAAPGSDLTVSVYLPGPTGPVSFHRNAHATGYVSEPGDHTADPDDTAFTVATPNVFLLAGVDVAAGPRAGVAVLGDSITEGVDTPDNANLRWPDQLAARLGKRAAVANLGISGNRVLLDDPRFGVSAQARFDRDVLALPGLSTLLVFLGVNDVQQPPQQPDPVRIVRGYGQLAGRARDHGLRVVGMTICPFEGWVRWTPEVDAVRVRVNRMLLDEPVFDAVIDVDAVLRDPERTSRLLPAFNSGDGLHPNAAGAAAIAAAVPLHLLIH